MSAEPVRARRPRLLATAALAGALLAALSSGLGEATGAPLEARTAQSRPSPCRRPRLHLRCPDLIMSAPAELHLDRSTIPGRVLLRATSSVDNHGSGPLELAARRVGRHRWRVYQAIYDRSGRRHLFARRARLVYKLVGGQRYGFGSVGPASYWKVRHVAAFQLWSLGRRRHAERLVRVGPKVDYCLRDLFRTAPSPRSPVEAVYPACSTDPGIHRDRFGTSVGWSDVYPYSYPEQWIDVTGLRGRFAYVQIADPDHLLLESRRDDDLAETYVALPSGRVLGRRVGVSRP